MISTWLAVEHHRIHLIENWPDGARKQASLASARSALAGLERSASSEASEFVCEICESRITVELRMVARSVTAGAAA